MSKTDVVIPCYNYGRFLEECVRSVLDQPVPDLRILIIDDASTDNSLAVANKLAASDPRVSVIAHPHNRGHIATYNEGLLDWATADYSLLLSADDVLTEGALARAIRVLDENPKVGLLYGHALYWYSDSPRPVARTNSNGVSIWQGREWLRIVCQRGHCVTTTPTAVVRTAVQQAIGGYRSDLPHSGDAEMWMRFAVHADVAYIRGVDQAFYRIHRTNMSVERVPIIDLRQRKAAYDAIFNTYGERIVDASALQQQAHRTLAKEALWSACSAYHGRRLEVTPVKELVDFASLTYPSVEGLPEYWGLRWRQRVGPKVSSYLRPFMLSAVHRRIRSWLWWRMFRLRGI
jgi:glycosyltransferase involved in cell wall biosynthesis